MENNLEITENKSQALRLTLEKLEGGFISNISGNRAIYRDADDILDALDMSRVIGKLENAEYKFNIDIVHKNDFQEYEDLIELRTKNAEESVMSVEMAKEMGIIESVDKYNPLPVEPVIDMEAPIKVSLATAYSASRLKSIKWAELHEQLPLQPSEITRITGMNTTTLYASLPKARSGKMQFQHSSARIGFTILAMYYERTLGIRSSTKDQCEKMKEDLLKAIREIELMSNGQKYVKTSELAKKLITMRNTLL